MAEVLIYFDATGRDRASAVADASCGAASSDRLARSLRFSSHAGAFEEIAAEDRVYRKRADA